ncbi:AP-4 complex subunit epsilon-1 isoform X1 [Alosa pseudoharengus]|uniref:AP-4 complex subunit epsilon-1 isoform X1 n=2 Tax=Alosa pseudoharengus TaxID=34774 RepID=UPI003F89A894
MSDVVEKTLTALPGLLSLDSQTGAGKLSSTSKLGNLIRSITELTSKHDEEKLIKRELVAIKEQVSSPNTTMRQMKEMMVRSIYCEMLGYEADFSYIHAIKLAQQGAGLEKRVGYLAVSLFLNENHELLLLLVNTVLKDLQSTNLIEVCMALTVVSQMFPKDMIPAILPLVEEKLTHPKEIIRRKAVLALHKFYLIAPNQVQHIHSKFRKALCDKDPGVMAASLHIYLQMIKEGAEAYRELAGSFAAILRQVVGGKLPVEFNYHSVPAPWLQIQLLRILTLLGKDDQSTSELMYDVLDESLRRAEINHNITYAILFECVKAIYTIHPNAELMEKAAKCIGNFVLSPKINLKYLGLKALTYVVQQDANLALQHQMTIIECLDHSDRIIKRETLELLFRITNAQNVTVIVEKMLAFLRLCHEDYTIMDLVGKVAELAEKYAPDNRWFVETMSTVFSVGGDLMPPDIPTNFLRLLSEGSDSEEDDRQLRVYAVESYVSLLQTDPTNLPQRFLQVISWVLGEYSHLVDVLSPSQVIDLLVPLLDRPAVTSDTRSWVLSAVAKLGGGACSGSVVDGSEGAGLVQCVAQQHSSSLDTQLRQQALELLLLSRDPQLQARVLPRATAGASLEVDSSLSFLDSFVSEALARGAAPYKPPHQRQEELRQEKALSLEPYGLSLPISLSSCSIADRQSPTLLSISSGLSGNSTELSHRAGSGSLRLDGVKRKWGKDGYLAQREVPEEPSTPQETSTPAPQPSPQQGGALTPPSAEPSEEERDKQQLASSLFIGLSSQNSTCLMGKPEASSSQRFRRKQKNTDSASSSSGSSHSSRGANHFLYSSLLEEGPVSPIMLTQNSVAPPKHKEANSTLSEGDTPSLPAANGVAEGHDPEAPASLMLANEALSSAGGGARDSPPLMGGMELVQPCPLTPDPSHRPLSSHLPPELQNLPCSECASLASDGRLALSCCRVHREDALVLVLLMANTGGAALLDVSVELQCPQLKVASLRGNALESLPSQSVSVCWYTLLMEEPHTHVEVTGLLSYRKECGASHTLDISTRLSLAHFLRPLVLSTEEYGKLWLSVSQDVKQNIQLLDPDGDPLCSSLTALQDKLQLHIVDIIGSEGIAACQLLRRGPCLLHCRVHAGALALWLRSPVPGLPDGLLYHCQRALQEC